MATSYNRIISLVPSLTELVIDLGFEEQLVGRTRFCIHPKEVVEHIPIIGGTKNPRVDKMVDLNPDLIIANKEENRPEDIHALREQSAARIEITDIVTIEDALLAIHHLGTLLGVPKKTTALTQQINTRLNQRPDESPLRMAYFIWKEPWMTVGGDTYIHDVLEHWKLQNIFAHQKRYPNVELGKLAERKPELILLSSEPYPFKEKHIAVVQQACPDARVLLVEGEWFSWYGSSMKRAFERLNVWRKAIG